LFAIAKKDGKIGFNLYGGGKFNESAKSLNIFIPKEMAKELFFKIIYYYLEYGSRGTRSKNRFYFLLEKINFNLKEELQKKFNLELEDKGELLLKESSYKIAPLKDEIFLKIFQSQKGELDIKYLKEIIEIAKKYNGKLRLSIDQNIFLFTKDKIKNSSSFSLTLICAGSRYCPFSLWDTKKEIDEIIERDSLDVKVGFSGCLKGCGKHHHSDIGIIGIRTNLYAPTEKAIRVYIGALEKNGAGRLLYYSVPKRKFKELFLAIIDDFKNSNYKNFFEFSKNILTFYSVEFLQLWYVAKLNNLISSSIYKEFFNLNEELIIKKIKEVTNFKEEDFTPLIKELSHKAWDI
jgi:ferredoxin-nitrite reductase